MLFAYIYMPHSMEKMQEFIDYILKSDGYNPAAPMIMRL